MQRIEGRGEGANHRGFTLVDVIVSIALLAMGLLFVVSLIPMGVLSLKKAENLQTAAAYAVEVVEASREGFEETARLDKFETVINDTDFEIERFVQTVPDTDGRLHDVKVVVKWDGQPVPVVVTTRMKDGGASPSPTP